MDLRSNGSSAELRHASQHQIGEEEEAEKDEKSWRQY